MTDSNCYSDCPMGLCGGANPKGLACVRKPGPADGTDTRRFKWAGLIDYNSIAQRVLVLICPEIYFLPSFLPEDVVASPPSHSPMP